MSVSSFSSGQYSLYTALIRPYNEVDPNLIAPDWEPPFHRPEPPPIKTYQTNEYKQVLKEADTRNEFVNWTRPDGKLSREELKEYQTKLKDQRERLDKVKNVINEIFGENSPIARLFNNYLKKETDKIDKKRDIANIMNNNYNRFAGNNLSEPINIRAEESTLLKDAQYPRPIPNQITAGSIDNVARTDGNSYDVSAKDVYGKYPQPSPPPPGPWNKFDFSTQEVQDVLKKAGTTTVEGRIVGEEYDPVITQVTEDQLKTFLKRKDITEKEAKIAQTLLDNMKEIGHQQWPRTYPITKPKWIISNEDVDKVAKEDGNSNGFSRLDLLIKKLKEAYNNWWIRPLSKIDDGGTATLTIPPAADPAPEPAPPPEPTTEP